MEQRKKILVAPLDWGLGHAARCIPIIRELLKRDCEVMIASSGRALILLQKEFPALISFELEAYDPQYPEEGSMVFKMAGQLPKFMRTISKEQKQVEKIVAQQEIDLVISDNRYGCYSKKVKSIIVTHQVHIQMPRWWKWMQPLVNRYNHRKLKQFAECWVPAPAHSFIPVLTKAEPALNLRYVGYLSRLEKKALGRKFDVCAICSGPRPQRGIFEKLVTRELKKSSLTAIVVRGKTEVLNKQYNKNERISVANYMTAEELNEVMEQSEIIIARSGYSTIMDLGKLKKKAIFIPTPGQTEQELIANELMKQNIALSVKQSKFDLKTSLEESQKFSGFLNFDFDNSLLLKAIDAVL